MSKLRKFWSEVWDVVTRRGPLFEQAQKRWYMLYPDELRCGDVVEVVVGDEGRLGQYRIVDIDHLASPDWDMLFTVHVDDDYDVFNLVKIRVDTCPMLVLR